MKKTFSALHNVRKYPSKFFTITLIYLGLCHCFHIGNALSSTKLSETGCVKVDEQCLDPHDVPNYEAIKSLHKQLDDDSNGNIDLTESVDFIKEELKHTKDIERRQERFHVNNDNQISVSELWRAWKQSDVHNWTVEMTIGWLQDYVGLHQYTETFYKHEINGSYLPRIAANLDHFVNNFLGVKSVDKTKLAVKAMDVVLFGPPKDSSNLFKDAFIILLLTVLMIVGIKFYNNNNTYKSVVNQMMMDMEKLREAEQAFREEFKHKLERTDSGNSILLEEEKISPIEEEKKEEYKSNMTDCDTESRFDTDFGSEAGDVFKSSNVMLERWLQLTYERETVAFNKRQKEVREQFKKAKDMCEKLNKKRQSLLGVLVSAHGSTMDNVEQTISHAKTIMEEVTSELREREDRWHNIEKLSGFNMTPNIGLHALELLLRPQITTNSVSPSYPSNIVHQLLSNQSALMFLTMGGYSGINTSCDSPSFLSSSMSHRDWRSNKESNLEGSCVHPSTQTLHQSHTSLGLSSLPSKSEKNVQRSTSDHLINNKFDSNESSADEGSISNHKIESTTPSSSDLTDKPSNSVQNHNQVRENPLHKIGLSKLRKISSLTPSPKRNISFRRTLLKTRSYGNSNDNHCPDLKTEVFSTSASEPNLETKHKKTPSTVSDDAISISSTVTEESKSKYFRKGAKASFISSLKLKSRKKHKDKSEAK